jgi:hypothetical protein
MAQDTPCLIRKYQNRYKMLPMTNALAYLGNGEAEKGFFTLMTESFSKDINVLNLPFMVTNTGAR